LADASRTPGATSTGKSCLMLRFTEGTFVLDHMATIGVDFRSKTVDTMSARMKLNLWDTACARAWRRAPPERAN